MGTWKGTADATQESAGGGGGGQKFPPAPRGFYTIQVADVKEGKTKESGRNKVDLECEIADEGPEFGKKVWLTITQIPEGEKGHGMMIHSLHAFGIGLDGSYELDPVNDLQGRQAKVLLGIEKRPKTVNKGTPQEKTFINDVNFVEALYTEKHPQPDELPAERAPKAAAPAAKGPQPSAAAQKVFGKQPATAGAGKSKDVPFKDVPF